MFRMLTCFFSLCYKEDTVLIPSCQGVFSYFFCFFSDSSRSDIATSVPTQHVVDGISPAYNMLWIPQSVRYYIMIRVCPRCRMCSDARSMPSPSRREMMSANIAATQQSCHSLHTGELRCNSCTQSRNRCTYW